MNIRQATSEDISRIAEILVFVKRATYRPIFRNDAYSFGKELQVLNVAKEYSDPEILKRIWVYDDGIVKGMIHLDGEEVKELYVDTFFQGNGIGKELLDFAKNNHKVNKLWVVEKNVRAVRFYEREGFAKTGERRLVEGTSEYEELMGR